MIPPADGSAPGGVRHGRGGPVVAEAFGRFPTASAVGAAGLLVGWILAGSFVSDPLSDTKTEDFIGDGLVRWPAAVLVAALLWRLRDRLPINLLNAPSAPRWFPWATILLTVVAVTRLTVVSQFWDETGFTAATIFSELSVGFLEELVFRGLIFGGLLLGFGRSQSGVRKAALLHCVLFGVTHIFSGPWFAVITFLFAPVFLLAALELRSLWHVAILHGLFDIGVNGSIASGDDRWNETLMGWANVTLLLGGIIGLVILGLWREWPIDAQTATSPPPPGRPPEEGNPTGLAPR